ncbi:protein TIC 56, chloroplastic isoform X2 [Dioscorea cayenensis subsp. rotundata]|uniref:Protein TIC 56, chloroplastic isoform X2 n=1 Tax=Dioscorea cayennensis subsp. rotundata TaxID=55577 RepID=A0AB40D128_DIOCR|nr:protein TIC 56, chloroplastic isoform X2 [Dioscorea cayenensis subsp. rotundata]
MASMNLGWFGDNWFSKPPKPVPAVPSFAFIGSRNLSSKNTTQNPNPNPSISSSSSSSPPTPEEPKGPLTEMLEQLWWECEHRPDYRHTPEVERIITEDPFIVKKENPTQEEIEENKQWWDGFNSSPVVQFLRRAEKIADIMNEMELKENEHPYRWEDRKLWKKLPHVPGLDGRPMPRKAIKTKKESDDKFWDWARQFFFGLWGFRQRSYPPGRPIDVAQAIGYKRLEKRYYDFIMRSGGWYYKDRLGRTRGPLELITLKTAWAGGIIDTHTFIWGEDMDEWAPIGMVYGLEKAIATWEVRLGAAATAFLHKLQKGIPPWKPLKGFEWKTYKQLQDEAIESKKRDMAVLAANGGIWPGVRTPSHALFLWASGSELTSILEADFMPNKYISKELRYRLAKIIPNLRPWEVLSIEQAMDLITCEGEWFREPLGSFTTGPPYIQRWNKDVKRMFRIFSNLSYRVYNKLERTIPGFDVVMQKVKADTDTRDARRKERRAAQKRAEKEAAIYGRRMSSDNPK